LLLANYAVIIYSGEHREIHAIWVILNKGKKGYAHHPEVLRWKGKLKALYLRHEKLVKEFAKRGYNHKSNLKKSIATGSSVQNTFVDYYHAQISILKNKKCGCMI
jgi:hypothetical protein